MNLNATLIAQMIVFLTLAWFTMKFVWPPLIGALDERAKKIADGLAAADRGKAEFEAVHRQIVEELTKVRNEAQQRISEAKEQAQLVADEIKRNAQSEAAGIINRAKMEAEQQVIKIRDALRRDVAILAVKGAEQILRREIDQNTHTELLNKLQAQL
ncbi:F0F1 ATP synthase subunit B [Candidatus Vallotia lariciata]|uniref:F0F1 ATP synthase subunit B n=1 Tax=Candidatus Vallotia laricis TaxID=2018052 RepID=UPI001D0244C3|nr:F0F1 ATP synthase subunit B [Candidatus Vallotia lariciata]UDG82695.1 ATP synthase subunit b [Candidatus Vallotia lariciata]